MTNAVEVQGLRKTYGAVEAVRGVDFDVRAGETFGFLGPNGAGKSTTIKILCTLARATAGSATVAGFDVERQRDEVRRQIGLVFQDTTLDSYLTAELNLRFHAELYGMVRACEGEVVIRHHRYPRVHLRDFVPLLIKKCGPQGRSLPMGVAGPAAPGFPKAGEPMRIGRLIGRLNECLTPDMARQVYSVERHAATRIRRRGSARIRRPTLPRSRAAPPHS